MAQFKPTMNIGKAAKIAIAKRKQENNPNIERAQKAKALHRQEVRNMLKELANDPEFQAKVAKNRADEAKRAEYLKYLDNRCKTLYQVLFQLLSTAENTDEAMEALSDRLAELKELSSELLEKKQTSSSQIKKNYYDLLFFDLTNKIDEKFVKYIDADKLGSKNIQYSKFSPNMLKTLDTRIHAEVPSLLQDIDFMDRAGYYLPSAISEIRLDTQTPYGPDAEEKLISHLARFPQNFRNADEKLYDRMINNSTIVKIFNNPNQIKYVPVGDLIDLIEAFPDTIGLALCSQPQMLEWLHGKKPNFFSNPKLSLKKVFYIGRKMNKKGYLDALGEYIHVFPEVDKYFASLPETKVLQKGCKRVTHTADGEQTID